MYARGRMPVASMVKRSSSRVSHRWVCRRTPSERPNLADSTSRSLVTENGEHGASTTCRIEKGAGSWNFSTVPWESARMASTL